LQIKGVTFGVGNTAKSWSAVSDFGGEAEVNQYCGAGNYGTPFCSYPWYAFNKTDNAFTYGGDYPGTSNDFGQALEFQQQQNCTSPAGPFPQYCSTVLRWRSDPLTYATPTETRPGRPDSGSPS
jgi:hypothetical protein